MTEIALFPIYFPYKKWGQKDLKSWIFQPKIVFRHVFWCYIMEIYVLDHLKPKKSPYFQDFGRFWPNRSHFFLKMGHEAWNRDISKSLKRHQLLQKTCYKAEIWPSWAENCLKKVTYSLFQILHFLGQKSIMCGSKTRLWPFWTVHNGFLTQKMQNLKNVNR